MSKGHRVSESSLAALKTANIVHGARRWLSRSLAPPCSRCPSMSCEARTEGGTCQIAEAYRDSIVERVMRLDHIRPEDEPLAGEYGQLCTALKIIDAYLSEYGLFLPGVETGFLEGQPVLVRLRQSLSNSLCRLASELGLSPASRARIARGADPRSEVTLIADALEASDE